MTKIAIGIDSWKLAIFTRHLNSAGFVISASAPLNDEALILTVESPSVAAIQPIIEAAQKECKTQ